MIFLGERDRIEEIRRYLDATLEEFQNLVEKAGGFDDARIGNGWNPANIKEAISTVVPMSPEEILENVRAARWRRLGIALRNLPKARTLSIDFEQPHLDYRPYWIAKAYHECFFFRGASYRVPTSADVVAVEVEGKLRNLLLRDSRRTSFLGAVKEALERATGLIPSDPRFFVLDGVTELARNYKEASLYLDAHGRYNRYIQRFTLRNPALQPIKSVEQLQRSEEHVEIMPLHETKDSVIRKLREAVVEPPKSFMRILSNRFEVASLMLLYLPVYRVKYRHAKKEGTIWLNGSTGEPMI